MPRKPAGKRRPATERECEREIPAEPSSGREPQLLNCRLYPSFLFPSSLRLHPCLFHGAHSRVGQGRFGAAPQRRPVHAGRDVQERACSASRQPVRAASAGHASGSERWSAGNCWAQTTLERDQHALHCFVLTQPRSTLVPYAYCSPFRSGDYCPVDVCSRRGERFRSHCALPTRPVLRK